MKQSCWPWKLTFEWLPKYRACSYHDKRYTYAKYKTPLVRYRIDRIFLQQMLIESPDNIKTAYIYYWIVRIFGWFRFYNIFILWQHL